MGLVVRMVRAVQFLLWCRDVPSDVAGWVQRNISVPAGRGSEWPRVASLWPPACPGWGFGGQEHRAALQPPFRLMILLTFCGERDPRTIRVGYMCRNPPGVPGV